MIRSKLIGASTMELNHMKGFAHTGIAAVAMSAFAAQAFAADLPYPADAAPAVSDLPLQAPTFDWNGAYIGASLGWGLGTFTTRSAVTGKFDDNADGILGGGFAGYNFMITPNIVTGVEADLQFSDLNASSTVGGVAFSAGSDWNSNIRGRIGYAFDRFLIYGTGGLAIADLNVSANGVSDSTTALGWTLGAGLESAITDNVLVRLDYTYQDFAREDFNLGGTNYSTDLDNNIIRAGIAYKF